jgi:hypothetical protein
MYKTLVHGSVNNAQDVCVVFIMNIFCVKDTEVQAFHALIVKPEVVRRWFIYCAIGFSPLYVENLLHVTFREFL